MARKLLQFAIKWGLVCDLLCGGSENACLRGGILGDHVDVGDDDDDDDVMIMVMVILIT